MSKAALNTPPIQKIKTRKGSYYLLKDGRHIAIPPKGGKIKRNEINKAVQIVVKKRLSKV